MESHLALPLPKPFPVNLQEHDEENGREGNGGLNTKDFCWPKLTHPFELDIRGHEPGPIPAGRNPRADLARAFGVAIQQICVDSRGDDHHAEALHRCDNGENHVMPVVLERQAENYQTEPENEGGWVGNDESSLGVKTSAVLPHVVTTYCIVEEVPSKPA